MSDKIQRAFEDQRNNPFQFKHLQLCHSIAELNKIPSPKVRFMNDQEVGVAVVEFGTSYDVIGQN